MLNRKAINSPHLILKISLPQIWPSSTHIRFPMLTLPARLLCVWESWRWDVFGVVGIAAKPRWPILHTTKDSHHPLPTWHKRLSQTPRAGREAWFGSGDRVSPKSFKVRNFIFSWAIGWLPAPLGTSWVVRVLSPGVLGLLGKSRFSVIFDVRVSTGNAVWQWAPGNCLMAMPNSNWQNGIAKWHCQIGNCQIELPKFHCQKSQN